MSTSQPAPLAPLFKPEFKLEVRIHTEVLHRGKVGEKNHQKPHNKLTIHW